MEKIAFPVLAVKMVPLIQIHANHYNPNKVVDSGRRLHTTISLLF